jgi:hypothetical protein
MKRIRENLIHYPGVVSQLIASSEEVYKIPLIITKEGIGNWGHYYYCPDCSIHLTYSRQKPKQHECPHCKKVFTGEPYDSSWWGLTHVFNIDGAYKMSQLFFLTQDKEYANKAIEILTTYAKYYKGYEVHGDIPYNGPGKIGAQTLDEANFLRTMALSVDLLSEILDEKTKAFLKEEMFLPGVEFLMAHRTNQIHNHEVIINSAIAIIGILFDEKNFINAAIYEKYGLIYQLEHGMQPNYLWFEGAFGYHYYALLSFMLFEKFAIHTPYSNIHHPNYQAMLELVCDYYDPHGEIPMLNDTSQKHYHYFASLYEFAYQHLQSEKLAYILNEFYRTASRDNLDALLYGVSAIPAVDLQFSSYHVPVGSSGHTILRGSNDKYLLIKHDNYGGEHDHYDRLAISYLAYGQPVSEDIGTTGYGAVLHYDYYKNTGTHNTVCIGEENQSPAASRLTRYEQIGEWTYVEADVDWTKPYTMPDSFTIVQWDEKMYQYAKMKRFIAWHNDFFVEAMVVKGAPKNTSIDWCMHFSGEINCLEQTENVEKLTDKKPLSHLHDIKKLKEPMSNLSQTFTLSYQDQEVTTKIFGMKKEQDVFIANGPNNPSTSDINYLIERQMGQEAVFAHVVTTHKVEEIIEKVTFAQQKGELLVTILQTDQVQQNVKFSFSDF